MLYRRLFKPAADRLLAAVGLVVLSPVIIVLTLAIRMRLGSPVLFRQVRIGWNDVPFVFVKFRTMTDQKDSSGKLLPDDRRMTPFGRFLRGSSLDELPQLWNVFRGDMALVGPRPLLPEYLPRYNAFQRRRHEVKPGITGWAQVNGRNSVSWERKFELDVWYVEHRSLSLDLKILWMTVLRLIRPQGISQDGQATMSEFRGSEFRG